MKQQANRSAREPEAFERAGQTTFDYQLHGGKGTAKFQWCLLDQSRLPVAVQCWDLQPGASEGLHAHDTERPFDELYLVIDGKAKMHVNGRV